MNDNKMNLENVELNEVEVAVEIDEQEMSQINGGGQYISTDPYGPGCNSQQS
jgi:hypothetical protein